jgi:hypothetical protein
MFVIAVDMPFNAAPMVLAYSSGWAAWATFWHNVGRGASCTVGAADTYGMVYAATYDTDRATVRATDYRTQHANTYTYKVEGNAIRR